MRIIGVSTGTLQLKPTFLEGSPAHGGAFGLIRGIARVAAMLSVLFALYVVLLVRGVRVMIRAR